MISRNFWYARLDSNQRPSESESDALSNCATGAYQNDMNLWESAIFQNGQIVVNGEGIFPLHWLEATDCNGLRRFAADRAWNVGVWRAIQLRHGRI